MSLTNFLEAALADAVWGATGYTPPATLHVSLHSTWPTEAGSGTELSGNGYLRAAITNNATNWPAYAGDQKANANPITFGPATGDWVEAVAMGFWDAASDGNLLARAWLGPDPPKIFIATVSDVFTAPGHGLANDDRVAVLATPAGTLPTGVSEGVLYFAINVSGDTFQLSTTQGGGAINLTTAGSGFVKRVVPKIVANGETLSFPASAVVISFD